MNYIELINRFWQLNKEHSFTGNETQLYFKLLDTCNSLGWKNPFNQSNGYICGELGITEKTLIKSRNKLQQLLLINFVSGKIKREKTIYTLLDCNNSTLTGSLTGSLSDSLMGSLMGENTPDNIKHKLNKTNIYYDNSEFSKILKSEENSFWLETVAMQQKKTMEEILKKIDDFNVFLVSIQKTHNSKSDYVSHFVNWVSKSKPNKSVTTHKPSFSINR